MAHVSLPLEAAGSCHHSFTGTCWDLSTMHEIQHGFLASSVHVACDMAGCAAVFRAVSALHMT